MIFKDPSKPKVLWFLLTEGWRIMNSFLIFCIMPLDIEAFIHGAKLYLCHVFLEPIFITFSNLFAKRKEIVLTGITGGRGLFLSEYWTYHYLFTCLACEEHQWLNLVWEYKADFTTLQQFTTMQTVLLTILSFVGCFTPWINCGQNGKLLTFKIHSLLLIFFFFAFHFEPWRAWEDTISCMFWGCLIIQNIKSHVNQKKSTSFLKKDWKTLFLLLKI